jgi:hypothetical protein
MFPGDDISRLIPENVRSILEDLKKTPIDYLKWLYGQARAEIYQGDILKSVTVYSLNDAGAISAREGPAVVVSHSCDCQPNQGEFILVAPIFAFSELTPEDDFTLDDIANFKRDLYDNRLKDQIFLPAVSDLPDSWLDLRQMFSISSQWFHSGAFAMSRARITSLSQKGHYFFLMRVGFFLGRPDPIDSKRR